MCCNVNKDASPLTGTSAPRCNENVRGAAQGQAPAVPSCRWFQAEDVRCSPGAPAPSPHLSISEMKRSIPHSQPVCSICLFICKTADNVHTNVFSVILLLHFQIPFQWNPCSLLLLLRPLIKHFKMLPLFGTGVSQVSSHVVVCVRTLSVGEAQSTPTTSPQPQLLPGVRWKLKQPSPAHPCKKSNHKHC